MMPPRLRLRVSLAVALVASLGITGCSKPACENHLEKQVTSADGLWKAVVFSRNCDATTPRNTHVSVLANSASLPDDGGNVYVSAEQNVTPYWVAPHELHLVRNPDAKVYKKKTACGAGPVIYEEKPPAAGATSPQQKVVEPAVKVATAAAGPYVQKGFAVREDYWGGDLAVKEPKAIVHQLFKGNEYWFWIGTDTPGARVSVHLYDGDGRIVESDYWQGPQCAAAALTPARTGTYYLIIEVEESPEERTRWGLVYGFR
jgi:hypothetical protein